MIGDRATRRLPGGEAAERRLKRVRKGKTTAKYKRWQKFWGEFCALGDGYRPYNEFTWTLWKWHIHVLRLAGRPN